MKLFTLLTKGTSKIIVYIRFLSIYLIWHWNFFSVNTKKGYLQNIQNTVSVLKKTISQNAPLNISLLQVFNNNNTYEVQNCQWRHSVLKIFEKRHNYSKNVDNYLFNTKSKFNIFAMLGWYIQILKNPSLLNITIFQTIYKF